MDAARARAKRLETRRERKQAKALGGRATPRSGGIFGADVILGDWNVELRRTTKKSYRINIGEFVQAVGKAHEEGRGYAMRIDFPQAQSLLVFSAGAVDMAEVIRIYHQGGDTIPT